MQYVLSPPKPWSLVLPLALAALTGILDRATGHDLALSPFYLVPICWACWAAGRGAGSFLALVSVIIWLYADVGTYTYSHKVIPYWNALMLLGLFLVVVNLLSAWQTTHAKLVTALGQLQNANEGLEEAVQQRTAALKEEIAERKRLEVAKLQAERLAVVGTMAAQVAHEVRNPLGSITLNLDLIQKELEKLADTSRYPPREGHVLVNEMRAEVQRIQHVIEDYLQFARLPKPHVQPLVVDKLLEQKLAFMQGVFEQANVELNLEWDPKLKTIHADPGQLWQAVLNLIRNGIEAMPAGGTLTVSTQRDDGHALLRVRDSGKGMTSEQLRTLFVPFFSTKASGSGLGLTLVQQIANEHGGHVECESEPGKGSTFTILLPLRESS